MKLLLDQNLSRRLIPGLLPHFPESTQVAVAGLEKATDHEIWQFAKAHSYIIVTKDSDFEELSLLKGSPPKVIWIKVGNTQNRFILDILIDNKTEIQRLLSQNETNCIELY